MRSFLGVLLFRMEYDEHTIDRALDKLKSYLRRVIKILAGDRGGICQNNWLIQI